MRNRNRSRRPSTATHCLVAVTTVLLPLVLACGGGKEPKTLPPQTVSEAGPELEPPPLDPPPPLPPPMRAVKPAPTETYKVIHSAEDSRPKTLVEASRLAKTQKATAPPPVIEINDENLVEQAEGGQVTVMSSGPAAPAPNAEPLEGLSADPEPGTSALAGASDPSAGPATTEVDRDEMYWRRRGLSIRRNWRDALDTIERLELDAASLRQQFYAQDDPYVRDNRIKPAWDRALDRIEDLRQDATLHEEALSEFLEEGRQEAIPTAWLNDGWELEPDESELDAFESRDSDIETQDAINVPVLEDSASDIESGGGR